MICITRNNPYIKKSREMREHKEGKEMFTNKSKLWQWAHSEHVSCNCAARGGFCQLLVHNLRNYRREARSFTHAITFKKGSLYLTSKFRALSYRRHATMGKLFSDTRTTFTVTKPKPWVDCTSALLSFLPTLTECQGYLIFPLQMQRYWVGRQTGSVDLYRPFEYS